MDDKPHHRFVVEDDPSSRDMLADDLEKQGMAVTAMPDAEDLSRCIHRLLTNPIDNGYAHGAGTSAEQFERARQPFVRLGSCADQRRLFTAR